MFCTFHLVLVASSGSRSTTYCPPSLAAPRNPNEGLPINGVSTKYLYRPRGIDKDRRRCRCVQHSLPSTNSSERDASNPPAMKSLADFLHLRNSSTSSSASSSSSKSFSDSPRKDSSAESSRQPTRRHTPAQSMSSVTTNQTGVDVDHSPERPSVRQRAASIGLARTPRGLGNMSTPNLLATASLAVDARRNNDCVEYAGRRASGGSSSVSRSTRKGASGSVSGFTVINGGRPPQGETSYG